MPDSEAFNSVIYKQYTRKYSTYRVAHSMITFHHAAQELRGSREGLRIFVSSKYLFIHVSCLTCLLFASSPIFPLIPQIPTTLVQHDEHLGPCERSHCEDLRQSGGFTQTVTPAGYEPKIIGINVIDSEAISPEDFEPRRIEFDRNLGTDPYQIHEECVRSSLTGDMEEFRKVGADVSDFQSQMHSEYDSAESIADSDLEDGELRKMLASPLYLLNREDHESSRMPIATAKLGALLQERSKCKTCSS